MAPQRLSCDRGPTLQVFGSQSNYFAVPAVAGLVVARDVSCKLSCASRSWNLHWGRYENPFFWSLGIPRVSCHKTLDSLFDSHITDPLAMVIILGGWVPVPKAGDRWRGMAIKHRDKIFPTYFVLIQHFQISQHILQFNPDTPPCYSYQLLIQIKGSQEKSNPQTEQNKKRHSTETNQDVIKDKMYFTTPNIKMLVQ